METALVMSSSVTADPSGLLAVMMTDTPPRMSRPWVIFSPSGVKPMTQNTRITARANSVPA